MCPQIISLINILKVVNIFLMKLGYKNIRKMKTDFRKTPLKSVGTRCCSWFRHCATSPKVAGSIELVIATILPTSASMRNE